MHGFPTDDHYFLFYIVREVLLKSNTCQPHQEEIQKKKINPNLKASGIIQEERKISFPSLISMTHIMLVQVTKTSSVSLYNLPLQRLQTPSMFPSIPMEISSLVRYWGFVDIKHPLKMQCINPFIQSTRKVGLHTLDNHSPWTLHLYEWKLYVIKMVSIY